MTPEPPEHNRPVAPFRAAGIGLRACHYNDLVEHKPDIGWIEVHPENYFGGGAPRHWLGKARELYPLSFHAVGLSLGSDRPVDEEHIRQIGELIAIYEPFMVSDHASWSASGNAHLHDLLPLPCTKETLDRICENIDRVQTAWKRPILIENPSTYLAYTVDEMPEYDFLNEIASRTGCGLLLDVNNIFVQSVNHGFDAYEYIDHINAAPVGEIHLAGHTERSFDDGVILVDTHNRPVRQEVWDLFDYTIGKCGELPSLIEWDGDIPALEELVRHADKAQHIIDNHIPGRETFIHAAE